MTSVTHSILSEGGTTTTITVDEAYAIIDTGPIAHQEESQHRWYTKELIVFDDTYGCLWGFYYLRPATELQEGEDEFLSNPVEVFSVIGEPVTTTVYRRE